MGIFAASIRYLQGKGNLLHSNGLLSFLREDQHSSPFLKRVIISLVRL